MARGSLKQFVENLSTCPIVFWGGGYIVRCYTGKDGSKSHWLVTSDGMARKDGVCDCDGNCAPRHIPVMEVKS